MNKQKKAVIINNDIREIKKYFDLYNGFIL